MQNGEKTKKNKKSKKKARIKNISSNTLNEVHNKKLTIQIW